MDRKSRGWRHRVRIRGGSQDVKTAIPPTMIALTPEHYNRIGRLREKKIAVKLELEVQSTIIDENQDSWNVVAEIPGGRKKDELVLIGAHLGTGCRTARTEIWSLHARHLLRVDLRRRARGISRAFGASAASALSF